MTPETFDAWTEMLTKHWLVVLIGLYVVAIAGDWLLNLVRAARGKS